MDVVSIHHCFLSILNKFSSYLLLSIIRNLSISTALSTFTALTCPSTRTRSRRSYTPTDRNNGLQTLDMTSL